MASRTDLERAKFVLDGSGNVCVAMTYHAASFSSAPDGRTDLEVKKFKPDGSVLITIT